RVERAQACEDPDRLRARIAATSADLERASRALTDAAGHREALRRAVDVHEPGLLDVALEAREQWAAQHKQQLMGSLAAAIEALSAAPSLRQLQRTNRRAYEDLLRLFPVWGCTLLSMGNSFSTRPGQIAR